jgi:cytoskeletal protein CcmA (bactofilin family)
MTDDKTKSSLAEGDFIADIMSISGELKLNGNLNINSSFTGSIIVHGNLTIGSEARITGEVFADNLNLQGHLIGSSVVNDTAVLDSGSYLSGSIRAARAILHPKSRISGEKTIGQILSEKGKEREKEKETNTFSILENIVGDTDDSEKMQSIFLM